MISFVFDFSEFDKLIQGGLVKAVQETAKETVEDAAHRYHEHVVNEVERNLHTTKKTYLESLSPVELKEMNTFIVALDEKAMWIEEYGIKEGFDMLPGLLKSKKAKIAKDGSTYTIVPFDQKQPGLNKKNANTGDEARLNLLESVKTGVKSKGLNYYKLETNANGTPKTGRLHSFNINSGSTKTKEGPYQGSGKVGNSVSGSSPYLQRVNIYQEKVKAPDGTESVKRGIFTFRIASSKQLGKKMWKHPGFKAKNFFEEGESWLDNEWETKLAALACDRLDKKLDEL